MTTKSLLASRRRSAAVGGVLLASVVSVVGSLGCDPPRPKELIRRAEFGIFFGGQIQERRELPFELDKSKQTLGFRVEFSEPLRTDTDVEWRIDRPPRSARGKANARSKAPPDVERAPIGGKDVARAGESRFDRTVSFEPGDPLGLWNVRVVVRGKVAVDRPFDVYDAAERQKESRADGGS
jgi:hypothetical protein